MSTIRVCVLTGYGLNCDMETAYSFEQAGAKAVRTHINSLIAGDVDLSSFQVLVFGGGFSWGDDHGAGVCQAVRMKSKMGDAMLAFVSSGKLVIGICNGFQALVNLGLLPGLDNDYTARSVALTYNDSGNFRDDWVTLRANPASPCVWTRGIDLLDLPVRHGEGKFVAEDAVLSRIMGKNMVALTYAKADGSPARGSFPENPNGSVHDIAGICDPTGRVFGLMPHPEAFNHPANHPMFTRNNELKKRGRAVAFPRLGIEIFKSAVAALK
ncbi:MAG: phosphoribosylformylglycinamidine synthase subunit PurQ [Thermodesulfobacteriota bacterium]